MKDRPQWLQDRITLTKECLRKLNLLKHEINCSLGFDNFPLEKEFESIEHTLCAKLGSMVWNEPEEITVVRE